MDKGNVTNGAFALPGLANQGKKPFGDKFSKRARDRNASSSSSRKSDDASKDSGPLAYASSLVDERGLFLPPKTELSLEHLTKSRPRNQGRRTPSPSARRKSWREEEYDPADSILKSDAGKPTTVTLSYARAQDSLSEKGRVPEHSKQDSNRVPAPNKSKPKYSSSKSYGSDLKDEQEFGDLPPPLPSSPPPLDPNKDSGNLEMTNLTAKKFPRASSTESSTMSTKMDYPRVETIDIPPAFSKNILLKSAENTQERFFSDSKRPYTSGDSFLKTNRKELMKTAYSTVRDGQSSLDSKYYRGSVDLEKSSSTRRRRFKPVAIPDKSESNSDTPQDGEDNLNRTFPRTSTSKSLFDSWLESSRERKQAGDTASGVTSLRHLPASTQKNDQNFISSTPKMIDPVLDRNRMDKTEDMAKRELLFSTCSDRPRLKSGMAVEYDINDNFRMGKTIMTAESTCTAAFETVSAASTKYPQSGREHFDSIDFRMLDVRSDTAHKPTNSAASFPNPEHDVLNQDILDGFSNSGDMSDDENEDFSLGLSQLESIPPPAMEYEIKAARSSYGGGKDIQGEHLNDNVISAAEDLQEYDNEGEEITKKYCT